MLSFNILLLDIIATGRQTLILKLKDTMNQLTIYQIKDITKCCKKRFGGGIKNINKLLKIIKHKTMAVNIHYIIKKKTGNKNVTKNFGFCV